MNDFKTIEDPYSRYIGVQTEANERNKARVFDALAAGKITSVTVTFDGSGDSGQIEDVTATNSDGAADIPATRIPFDEVLWGSSVRQQAQEIALSDAIENLCYGYLSQMYGGWENNDGAFGEFTFDVAKRTIEFEFNGRYTEHSSDNHTL